MPSITSPRCRTATFAVAAAAVAVLALVSPASASAATVAAAGCSDYVTGHFDNADAGVSIHVLADSCGYWHRATILVAPLDYPLGSKHWVRSGWLRGTGYASAAGGFGSPDAYAWGYDELRGGRSVYHQTGS